MAVTALQMILRSPWWRRNDPPSHGTGGANGRLRLVTKTEAQTVNYGTGSFTIANVSNPGHTDLPFVGADGSTEGTRLFVGNLTLHSSEVPNTAFGIDWLLW